MSDGFMTQRVVEDIGNYISAFIPTDPNNFIGVLRDFLRVRIAVDLDKQLKRRMKLKRNEES